MPHLVEESSSGCSNSRRGIRDVIEVIVIVVVLIVAVVVKVVVAAATVTGAVRIYQWQQEK